MDGYEGMIETEKWKALKIALAKVFDAQKSAERKGFSKARLRLADAENNLRSHFKLGRTAEGKR